MANIGGRRVLKQAVSSAGIDGRREIEQLRRLIINMSGHNGIRIVHGTRGIQFFGTQQRDACEPLKVSASATDADGTNADGYIKVCVGTWTRNGQRLTLQSDFDRNGGTQSTEDYTIGPLSASTTQYVWAELQYNGSSPLKDAALIPDTVEVVTDTTLPDDLLNAGDAFDTRNKKILLATVTVDSDGKISDVDRHWYGGDFDDSVIVPDGEWDQDTPVTDLTNDPRYTLELNRDTTSGHEGELQLWGVDDAGYTSSNAKGASPYNTPVNYGVVIYDPAIIDNANNGLRYIPCDTDLDCGAGAGLGAVVGAQSSLEINVASDTYLQAYQFDGPVAFGVGDQDDAADKFLVRDADDGGNVVLKYFSFNDLYESIEDAIEAGTIEIEVGDLLEAPNHTDLDFTNTDESDLGVGISGGNTDQDDCYWRAYDDSSGRTGHNTFVDSKDFRTTGEVRADDFYINDRTANLWNAEGFDVDVTDDGSITTANDFIITTGTTFDVTATGKATIDSASATGLKDAYVNSAGSSVIEGDLDAQIISGLRYLSLTAGGGGSELKVADMAENISGTLTIDGNTTIDAGNFSHGHRTAQMASIAPYTSGGITTLAAKFNTLIAALKTDGSMAT